MNTDKFCRISWLLLLSTFPYCQQVQIHKNPLFVISEEAKRNIPKEKLELFERAQIDVDLIWSNQKPISCGSVVDVTFDGGTKTYHCSEYSITKWHAMTWVNGIMCWKNGISLCFSQKLAANSYPLELSQTWYEPWPNQPGTSAKP